MDKPLSEINQCTLSDIHILFGTLDSITERTQGTVSIEKSKLTVILSLVLYLTSPISST